MRKQALKTPNVCEAFPQRPTSGIALMVRATGEPNSLIASMRNAVAQVDSELPLSRLMSMSAVIDRQTGGDTFFSRALAAFALLALVLAAIGIYGLIAYSVGQRTYEIGIRMAMGARSQDILRMIFRQGVRIALIGGAIGLAMAILLPKVFDAILIDAHVHEPVLYLVVPLAILATYIPARWAARVDPMDALRQE